ncbi:MAG: TlpA family protein disulfide reductase [Gammaproteobacteria bacterium]|nr:TlpA family protein disulfide reductase [Gammaproteobacteria bacterium]
MKKYVKYTAYLATFIIGMWGGNLLIQKLSDNSEGSQAAQAMVKHRAPSFELPDLSDQLRKSSEWNGKVVVLNFWATWCPPCRSETPTFVELQEQYGVDGVQFVGIAIDNKESVQDFVDTYGVNYPVLIGEDSAIEIAKAYGDRFGALPYTVIIDRQGQISFVQRGELSREVAEKNITQLLQPSNAKT